MVFSIPDIKFDICRGYVRGLIRGNHPKNFQKKLYSGKKNLSHKEKLFYIESDRKGSEQEGDGNVRIKLPMGSESIQTYIEEVNPKPALGPPSAMRKVVYLRQSPTGIYASIPTRSTRRRCGK